MGLVFSLISVDLYRRQVMKFTAWLWEVKCESLRVWTVALSLSGFQFRAGHTTAPCNASYSFSVHLLSSVFYVAVSFADQCFLSSFPWSLWCFLCSAAVASFLWCTFPCSLTCSFSFPSISPLDTRHTYFPPACFSQASEPFHFSVVSAAASRSNCC